MRLPKRLKSGKRRCSKLCGLQGTGLLHVRQRWRPGETAAAKIMEQQQLAKGKATASHKLAIPRTVWRLSQRKRANTVWHLLVAALPVPTAWVLPVLA